MGSLATSRPKEPKEETALSSWELKELELFRRNFPDERWRYSPDCTNAQSKQEGPEAEMHALPSPSPCPSGSWWFPLLSKYTQKQRARSLRIASHRILPSGGQSRAEKCRECQGEVKWRIPCLGAKQDLVFKKKCIGGKEKSKISGDYF